MGENDLHNANAPEEIELLYLVDHQHAFSSDSVQVDLCALGVGEIDRRRVFDCCTLAQLDEE